MSCLNLASPLQPERRSAQPVLKCQSVLIIYLLETLQGPPHQCPQIHPNEACSSLCYQLRAYGSSLLTSSFTFSTPAISNTFEFLKCNLFSYIQDFLPALPSVCNASSYLFFWLTPIYSSDLSVALISSINPSLTSKTEFEFQHLFFLYLLH